MLHNLLTASSHHSTLPILLPFTLLSLASWPAVVPTGLETPLHNKNSTDACCYWSAGGAAEAKRRRPHDAAALAAAAKKIQARHPPKTVAALLPKKQHKLHAKGPTACLH